MGLFSKKECCICNEKAGMLTRKKLVDGSFLCGDCGDACSGNLDNYKRMSLDDVLEHMDYVVANAETYENEFKETASILCGDEPIISIDGNHGWWVVLDGDLDIFTFDQIKHFEFNLNTNYLSEDERKLKKSFIMEVLNYSNPRHDFKKCPRDAEISGMSIDVELEHPWFDSIHINLMDAIIVTPSDIQKGYACADNIFDFLENPKG